MSDHEAVAAAGTASDGKSARGNIPPQPAAATMTWRDVVDMNERPLSLTLDETTRIRGHIEAIVKVCEEIGVQIDIGLRTIDDTSAWDVLPESEAKVIQYLSSIRGVAAFSERVRDFGVHHVTIYTGDVVPAAVES